MTQKLEELLRMAEYVQVKHENAMVAAKIPIEKLEAIMGMLYSYAAMLREYADGVDGWRTIETAPKKGRQLILLLTPSRFPQVAFSNTWWTYGFSVECKPTHWMELPELPPLTAALSGREDA